MNYSVDKDSNRTLTIALYILYIVAIFSAGILAIVALVINYKLTKITNDAKRFF